MDEQTMFKLLEVYNASLDFSDILYKLIGKPFCDVDPSEGILGALDYVPEVITKFSPVYDPTEDYEESRFWQILDDREIDNHVKARLLLGLV